MSASTPLSVNDDDTMIRKCDMMHTMIILCSTLLQVNPDNLMTGGSQWVEEEMPFPRVGGLGVLLPNGEILIMNGAA